MIECIDRIPTYKNRKKITYEDGTSETVTIENADEPIVDGTPINRENLMAMQGYHKETVIFGDTIIKTNENNETETITFKGSQIIKQFVGEKTITQTITFTKNGYAKELS